MCTKKKSDLMLIARCLNSTDGESKMFFNGFLKGQKINEIQIDKELKVDEVYLIEIIQYEISNRILKGKTKNYKVLDYE